MYYYILSTLPKLTDAARLAQAPGIAEEIGKLAVAGGAPILDTGKAVITVMNTMGLASDDAAVTMANLRKVTDQMFATVRESLREGMAFGPLAKENKDPTGTGDMVGILRLAQIPVVWTPEPGATPIWLDDHRPPRLGGGCG